MALAPLAPALWECRAIPSWHSSDWWVQIEHHEPARGGWVRYALRFDATQGLAYFATREAAQAAITAFLDTPSVAQCCTQ